jgi:surface protein
VGNVTDMVNMFNTASSFNQPIANWDVRGVANMYGMFYYTSAFNQPIGNWNVSNVTNMSYMFFNASSFNQPIGNWNVSNVINMVGMFGSASSFNQPLGNWDLSSVSYMSYMFRDAKAFNQPIENWDVSNVSDMTKMFCGAISFCQNISTWRRPGWPHIYLMGFKKYINYRSSMFDGANAFNNVYNGDNLKQKIMLLEAFPSIDSTQKKYISKLKKLFKKRDYTNIDVGIHLIKSLNDKVLYEYFLNEVKIHENGEFIRSKYFTGSGPAQPFLDYILLSLINTAPSKAIIDESIKPASIKRIFLEAEYSYHTGGHGNDEYWTRDCGIYTANQLPDLAFENLEEITLNNYQNLESLKFLLNCKKLKKINIADLDNIKDTNIFIKGVVKKNDHYDNHNTITPRNK